MTLIEPIFKRLPAMGGALCLFGALSMPAGAAFAEDEPVPASYRNEVMAVVSKAGCNAGACHGNASGKGGFKLSLWGEDPEGDHRTLTREFFSRRINTTNPDESLLLLKATAQIAHEGGKRFAKDSEEYAILRQWIADGAPLETPDLPRAVELTVTPGEKIVTGRPWEQRLTARVRFSDGAEKELTGLTVFEASDTAVEISRDGSVTVEKPLETTVIARYLHLQTPVRLAFIPERPEFEWTPVAENNYVDRHILAKLKTLRINPSGLADDSVFVRRAYLDLLGRPPTGEEARAFVTGGAAGKRARLIDQLLEDPGFADFWALKWCDLLRVEEKALDRKGVQAFHRWIRDSIASDRPLNAFAYEIVAARGSTYTNPPANYYRSLREPLDRAETTAQVFLGTRLQCARCHNHPFDRWTQDDYYSWGALFPRVRYTVLENRRRDSNDSHEFIGEQIVWMAREGEMKNPATGENATPKLLGLAEPLREEEDRLLALAEWIARDDNEKFAKVQVNRIWNQLMGRGLVHPVDDFRATNPASHPELLDELARDFMRNDFSLKHVVRTVMNSRTYQLDYLPNPTNRADALNCSKARVKRLDAEQLLDSLTQFAGVPVSFNGYPEGIRAAQIPGVRAVRVRSKRPSSADRFLKLFGKPPRLIPSETERSCETTLGQTFQLVSGPLVDELLTEKGNVIERVLEHEDDATALEALYWEALSRLPTDAEAAAFGELLAAAGDRRAAFEDIAWGLLNSKEFLFRH